MTIIRNNVCGECGGKLTHSDVRDELTGLQDTYVCKMGHLNFEKFNPDNVK